MNEHPYNQGERQECAATGNEAIARGAIEAGIGFASTYPGTPASQIGDSFYEVQDELPWLHFEYSMNEKIAVEGAIGAVWSDIRAIASMNAPGVNVAAEPLFSVCYFVTSTRRSGWQSRSRCLGLACIVGDGGNERRPALARALIWGVALPMHYGCAAELWEKGKQTCGE